MPPGRPERPSSSGPVAALLAPASAALLVPVGGGQGLCVNSCWVTMETPGAPEPASHVRLKLDPGWGGTRMREGPSPVSAVGG